jgi:hypothetical protein
MRDEDLDRLLTLAGDTRPRPSDALRARVLADAAALQPRPRAVRLPGVLARVAELFGGPPALAGVALAAVAGLAVGYLNPAAMDLLPPLTGPTAEALDLFPASEFLMTEG